ncbi:hypothetical protein HYC85_024121 [Camellia sinensis]|uniref:thymidine kinase n=1 Tax=Camellia sinensis TaxID=4442 RepID=A0A7J7G8I7_CAMSI|nr:hypothetical protein HYC85_024121 [Camellia sinensis]
MSSTVMLSMISLSILTDWWGEDLGDRPNPDPRIHAPTIGKVLLKSRGFFTDDYMFWISRINNPVSRCSISALSDSKSIVLDEDVGKKNKKSSGRMTYEGYSIDVLGTTKLLQISNCHDDTFDGLYNQIAPTTDPLLDVIGIDEAQFFGDLYDFCCKVADCDGKIVIVAGLDGDYLRRTFGSVLHIIPLVDSITKLTAQCQLCGKRAFFTLRKTNETKTELIGGSDVYMPVCRQHYVSVDLSTVDLDIPFSFIFCVGATTNAYSNLAVLAIVTWPVLFVSIPMVLFAIHLQRYYFATTKELMQPNGTTKSLVANHLAESIAGSMTIRAFEEEDRFFVKNLDLIDVNTTPFSHSFAANEWLIQQLKTLTAIVLSSLVHGFAPFGNFQLWWLFI